MTNLMIPYFPEMYPEQPSILSDRLMESGAKIRIAEINWKDFPYKPEVVVYTGYCDQRLWLHYVVQNDFVRAVCRQDQEPVWQDSCVEFFIKQGDLYRNFEFNSLGVCLSAYGRDRNSRNSLNHGNMAEILRFPSLDAKNLPDDQKQADWSLTVGLPLHILGLEAGSQFMANFYKCGDETKIPHYVSWAPIYTSVPDFHRPEFFGPVELVKN